MIFHHKFFLLILGLPCICQDVLAAYNLSQEYQFSAAFAGDDYVLHWTVNLPSQEIRFAVNVSTSGWIGFGLSPTGQMPGSDVVIGWIDDDSTINFYDGYAATRSLPLIDSSQDWFHTNGLEDNGRTILEFNRKLLTCDDKDIDIKAETARVIWSYNSRDPASYEELSGLQHSRQGSASLNLLGGLAKERVEDKSSSFSILNDNVTIPSDKDTIYWCTVHELPEEIVQQERYMYKFSPDIFKTTSKYVHHMLAYICTSLNQSHVGASQECSPENNININTCRFTGKLFASWAIGGTVFVYPEGVSYPLGGNGQKYIVLEMHYDNPDLDSGMVDNSGLKLFYVNEEPKHRAGTLTFGQRVSSRMVIPPKAENFVVHSVMERQCTEKFFPEEGINIFGNLLHTHLAGHGVVVRHLRETDTCGGLEELQPIEENRRYDFNYQQINILPRIIPVLPGDILQLECYYRTTDPAYKTVILGGESTREEMCLTFLFYYPEIDMTYSTGNQNISQDFTSQHFEKDTEAALFNSFELNNHTEVKNIFKQVEWNSETVASFQNSVDSATYSAGCINTTGGYSVLRTTSDLPKVICPYKLPAQDCPNTSGSPSIYYYTYFTLVVTMLSFLINIL